MAIIYLNDKNKVETVSYKNIIMDMRTKMDESFKIEEQAYRMAAEYAEELIEEYSIETGPFYLTPSSFYENIEDAEGIRKYVFLSEDGAYTLAIGLDVSSCDQKASILYLHNTEQGIYFFNFDNAVWELLDEEEEDEYDRIGNTLDRWDLTQQTKEEVRELFINMMLSPNTTISKKITELLDEELRKKVIPLATIRDKTKSVLTTLRMNEGREVLSLISPTGIQDDTYYADNDDCDCFSQYYTGPVITYVDGIYQLCQCLCTRAKTGYKPDSDKWEECWMDDIDLEYQAYIRVIEKTGDIKKAMKMVKYHFCEMQEKTLPLSESAYVSYDGRNRDYRMHIRGQRKKMTEIEKKNYQETISLIDKLEQY